MSARYSLPEAFARMVKDYCGGSMDPVYFAVLKMIEEDFIGEDEPETDDAAKGRNILRKKQREVLNKPDGDSLDDMSVRSVIALVLDDYRIAFTKPKEDRVIELKTPHEVAESLCYAIECYLAPKTRETLKNSPQNEIEASLWPLFTMQMTLLGGIK